MLPDLRKHDQSICDCPAECRVLFLPTVREELLQRGRKLSAHSLWQMLLPNYGGVSGKRSLTCIVRTVTSRKGRKAGHQREHSVADTVCSQILYLGSFGSPLQKERV